MRIVQGDGLTRIGHVPQWEHAPNTPAPNHPAEIENPFHHLSAHNRYQNGTDKTGLSPITTGLFNDG